MFQSIQTGPSATGRSVTGRPSDLDLDLEDTILLIVTAALPWSVSREVLSFR